MQVKDDVTNFLDMDQNIRMCPGKKDYLKSEGKLKKNPVLCM